MKNKKGFTLIELLTTIIVLAGIILILLGVTGCNKQVLDFDYTYDKAICLIGEEYKEFELKSWTDYDGEQLQLKDKEGNTYLVSSVNCTLIGD